MKPALALAAVVAVVAAVLLFAQAPDRDSPPGPDTPADPGAGDAPPPPAPGDAATVLGVVHGADGKPEAGHFVHAEQRGRALASQPSDARGRYEVGGLAAGPARIWVLSEATAMTVRALSPGERRRVDLHLPAGGLTVEVRERDGRPRAGAIVSLHRGPSRTVWSPYAQDVGESLAVEPAVETAKTDEEGRTTFPTLPGGTWIVTASAPDRARTAEAVFLPRGTGDGEPVLLVLVPARTLSGRVLDPAGEPIPGALVCAAGSRIWESDLRGYAPWTRSDDSGNFRLEGLPAGRALLSAARHGASLMDVATVNLARVSTYDIVLPAGCLLRGQVGEQGSGAGLSGALVVVLTGNGWDSQVQGARTLTDAHGNFELTNLRPGRLGTVLVEKRGWAQVTEVGDVELREHLPASVEIAMVPGARIEGTVLGPDGPVAGANVFSSGPAPGHDSFTFCDSEGRFVLDSLAAGPVRVGARAEGLVDPGSADSGKPREDGTYREAGVEVVLEAGGVATATIEMIRGGVLTGTVTNEAGEPVEGAEIQAAYWHDFGHAVTGPDGTYRITNVSPAGIGDLQVSAEGYRDVWQPDLDLVPEGEPLSVDFVLTAEERSRATVSGRILPDGPLEGRIRVQVQEAWDHSNPMMDEPLSWGPHWGEEASGTATYSIPVSGEPATLELRAVSDGFIAGPWVRVEIEAGRKIYEADLPLPTGHGVRGRVVSSATGEGVTGAAIVIAVPGGGGGHIDWMDGPPAPTVHAVTGPGGNFEIDRVPAGRYRIGVTAPGLIPGGTVVTVPLAEPLRLTVGDFLSIDGHVRYADGTTPGVLNLSFEAMEEGREESYSVETAEDGSFQVRGVSAGRYRAKVSDAFDHRVNILEEEIGEVAAGQRGVVLTARRGLTISGRVLAPDGSPVDHAYVKAEDGGWHRGIADWTAPDGSFEVLGLTEGVYELVIEADGHLPVSREGVVAGASGLDIQLSAGLSISGVLTDEAGKPQGGRTLYAVDPDHGGLPSDAPSTTTNADGSFTITGLEAGVYELALGYDYARDLAVLLGAERVRTGATGLAVTVSPGAVLRGIVTDDHGRPLRGVEVDADPSTYGYVRSDETGPDGRFEIDTLHPEKVYELTIEADGHADRKIEGVRIGDGEVEIVLTVALDVSGTALDKAGEPLVYIWLSFYPDRGKEFRELTNDEGEFFLKDLPPGRYTVLATIEDEDGGKTPEVLDLGEVEAGKKGVTLRAR